MSRSRRAVITGIGPVTCIGEGKDDFWSAILAGTSGIRDLDYFDTAHLGARCAGQIPGFDIGRFIRPQRARRLDRYAQFALASALLALRDSGLEWSPRHPDSRRGVSFGTALAGIANAELEHVRFIEKGPRSVTQTLALQIFGGSAHANIAIECGFRGVGTTNTNSCASGTVAVGEALRYIRDGWADVIVAGGSEAPLCPLTFHAFDFIRTMSRHADEPHRACRPFDLNRDGFVMGEGAASLVIEEYGHAKKRGARIYAEVLGYSLNNDAHHMTSPLPSGESTIRAMRDALADAHTNPEDVDYINGHASATKLNDATETACIKHLFGAHAARIPLSGTKAFTAHPLGATGAIEAALCALAIHHGYIPPTLHRDTPDPDCDLDVVPHLGREQKLRRVLSNSFGFGGINACLVLGAV